MEYSKTWFIWDDNKISPIDKSDEPFSCDGNEYEVIKRFSKYGY